MFEGIFIKRRTIIKYVANKLGGVHFDPRRNAVKEPGFVLLDVWGDSFDVFGKPSTYFELLSIGQAVARSEDAARFLERAREM